MASLLISPRPRRSQVLGNVRRRSTLRHPMPCGLSAFGQHRLTARQPHLQLTPHPSWSRCSSAFDLYGPFHLAALFFGALRIFLVLIFRPIQPRCVAAITFCRHRGSCGLAACQPSVFTLQLLRSFGFCGPHSPRHLAANQSSGNTAQLHRSRRRRLTACSSWFHCLSAVGLNNPR